MIVGTCMDFYLHSTIPLRNNKYDHMIGFVHNNTGYDMDGRLTSDVCVNLT